MKLEGCSGAEHKIDCIVDIGDNKIYIYDNGRLVLELSENIESWYSFEHYIINPLKSSGNTRFTIFDASVISYPQSVGVDRIRSAIGKFNIYKCEHQD